MKGFDGMCKVPLIILFIIISLAIFLLDLQLGKSRNCNKEVTLEYEEKSFGKKSGGMSLNRFKPLDIQISVGVPNGRSAFESWRTSDL